MAVRRLEDSSRSLGIFGFYDASLPEITRKVSATHVMFDKGSALKADIYKYILISIAVVAFVHLRFL